MDEAKAKILGDFYTLRAGISYISREKSRAQKLIKKNGDYIQKERDRLYALPAAQYDEVKEVLKKAESSNMSCEQTCAELERIANGEISKQEQEELQHKYWDDFQNSEKYERQLSAAQQSKYEKSVKLYERRIKVLSIRMVVAATLAVIIAIFGAMPIILHFIRNPGTYNDIAKALVKQFAIYSSVTAGCAIVAILCSIKNKKYNLGLRKLDLIRGGLKLITAIGSFVVFCLTANCANHLISPTIGSMWFWIPFGVFEVVVLLFFISLIFKHKFKEWLQLDNSKIDKIKNYRQDVLTLCRSYKTAVENANKNTEETYKAVVPAVQTCQTLYNALVEQYSSLLDVRDWEFLDFFIYYFETNRVDTVREALLLADNERRADRIVQAVQSAAREISHTLNRGFEALGSQISLSFSALSDRIDNLTHGINKISGGLNAINGNLITMGAMNSALMAKANTDSRQLMDDVHQMRVLADSAEVRRRTT